jgi:hypothetical protein
MISVALIAIGFYRLSPEVETSNNSYDSDISLLDLSNAQHLRSMGAEIRQPKPTNIDELLLLVLLFSQMCGDFFLRKDKKTSRKTDRQTERWWRESIRTK